MERTIERAVLRECRRRGWLCIKLQSPGLIGLPDRLVIQPGGRVCFLELKQPGGRVSRQQRLWLQLLNSLGVTAAVAYSVAEAMEVLDDAQAGRV